MTFSITTQVAAPPAEVWKGFTQDLFNALAPPFPPVKLRRFDGSLTGDEVHLELNFLLFKQVWISHITEHQISDEEIYFVDEGRQLPFFLSYWRHKHRIVAHQGGSLIVDEISFRAPLGLSWLLFPSLYLQFAYRKPIYKRIFGASR